MRTRLIFAIVPKKDAEGTPVVGPIARKKVKPLFPLDPDGYIGMLGAWAFSFLRRLGADAAAPQVPRFIPGKANSSLSASLLHLGRSFATLSLRKSPPSQLTSVRTFSPSPSSSLIPFFADYELHPSCAHFFLFFAPL